MAAVPSIGRAARIEGAAAPEAELTRALYEQYGNQIFRYCVHQLGSREEAEDAVQSTFLNAFRGIKRGIVPELESAWLFKIAHNVCLSRRRTSWRRGRIESPTDFDVVEETTPAPSRRADELMGLQDVLAQMPENQRRAILLREWQGLSYREIADELGLSQAAVETLIFRARRSLAAGLEQPSELKPRVVVRGVDLGNIVAGLKSLLIGGGAAAKVAATVAVVSAGTVVAAEPVQLYHARSHRPIAPAAKPAKPVIAKPPSTLAVAVPASSTPTSPVPGRAAHARSPLGEHRVTAAAASRRKVEAPIPDAVSASTPVEAAPAAPVVPAEPQTAQAAPQPEPKASEAAPSPVSPPEKKNASRNDVHDNRALDSSSKGKDNGKANDGQREKSNRSVAIPSPTPVKGHKTRSVVPVDPQAVSMQPITADPGTTPPPAATTPVTPPAPAQTAPSGDSHGKNGKGAEKDD